MRKMALKGLVILSIAVSVITLKTLEELQEEKNLRRVRMIRENRKKTVEKKWIDLSSP